MEVVKLLLEGGTDPNQADEVRATPSYVLVNLIVWVHRLMGSHTHTFNAKP